MILDDVIKDMLLNNQSYLIDIIINGSSYYTTDGRDKIIHKVSEISYGREIPASMDKPGIRKNSDGVYVWYKLLYTYGYKSTYKLGYTSSAEGNSSIVFYDMTNGYNGYRDINSLIRDIKLKSILK